MDAIAVLLLLCTLSLWTCTSSLVVAAGSVPPSLLVALTFLAGGALLGLRRAAWRASARELLFGALCFAAYRQMTVAAFALAPALPVNLVMSLSPLLIVLLPPVVLGPPYRWRGAHAVGALCGGAAAACTLHGGGGGGHPHAGIGLAFAFACAVLWALYALVVVKRGRGSSAPVGAYLVLAGLIGLAATACDGSWRALPRLDASSWLVVLALGLGPTGIAYATWDAALRRSDPRLVGAVMYTTPVTSTLLLALCTHQALGWRLALATVLVTCGALCTVWRQDAAPRAAAPTAIPTRGARAEAAA
jgi:drug/metabolite transporter (DMT)-like permease